MELSWVNDLQTALDTFNWAEADSICQRLVAELDASATPYEEKPAIAILQALRRKRQFGLMALVADALVRGGQNASQILRQYAQAMIDQGYLTAAQILLKSIIDDAGSPPEEKAEANGLLGRIYKQLYVNVNDASNPRQQRYLQRAIQYYFDVYQTNPKEFLWHGINVVALIGRAQRDHVAVPHAPPLREIALEIDASLRRIEHLWHWDRATAIENAVALGDFNGAYGHALYFAMDQKADAFEIASLLRQLTDVWQLGSDVEPGRTLLPILRIALLKREGGELTAHPKALAREAENTKNIGENLKDVFSKDRDQLTALTQYEKVFGTDRYETFGWWQLGLERFRAVARVETVTGSPVGTGFLVKAGDFFQNRNEGELLLLTNAHVISPADKPFPDAIRPEVARVNFEATGRKYKIEGLVWSSPPGDFDATFLTIKDLKESGFCPLEPPPEAFDAKKNPRAYVVGYPLGGQLAISFQDSIWLDANERLMHYRTPTQPGSSGSPVFDQHYWSLIGLHHAGRRNMPRLKGSGTYEANEGIAIAAIRQATFSLSGESALSPTPDQL